ncbi:amino acid ABC transporter permease [Streptococcus gallolyticus]|uniref:Amino acid ABC transporter permease n=1 Tax=Streptococcus gallolyticus TaxID=315405 RepID=A0A927XF53_9STRE|nr:amino acid ABC transporter permease [Streptococcus gallolyticus]MBE6164665.1 amino acid ABC transporter permease [Streptococcus gallolyticus]MCY7171960.1 amino acid ABC transporter permease [Streptococcus gallolyticus subsp. gallolyticus]SDJ84521.1 amino acid ABC transporter membrane protein 1, PAAT family (TC 3.A.1.3.-) [Streptococcus gallolyticus]SDL34318.1 amino acid ABC transporter membrane protein 1, PAAT family (TC 3.A.1.3.-) [Streptococcus gallolyticus]
MVSYEPSRVITFLPEILSALPLTLWVLVLTILFGSLLGLFLAWSQLSGEKSLSSFARGYVFILRCTPPIVLIFLVFYGLPRFLEWWLGIDVNGWSRSVFVILAMTLLFAASISEVFKSSYQALPKGQLEAGLSIGLTDYQTFVRILLPQAFRIALPNITTAIINLLKDIALAYTIGLVDLMGAGNLVISRNLGNYSLETYTAVAIIYWGLALILAVGTHFIENELDTTRG